MIDCGGVPEIVVDGIGAVEVIQNQTIRMLYYTIHAGGEYRLSCMTRWTRQNWLNNDLIWRTVRNGVLARFDSYADVRLRTKGQIDH